jgi:hypothetical protein
MFEIFKLDLDNEDFKDKLGEANKLLASFGTGDDLAGLLEKLTTGAELAAALGVAYLAVKGSIDWTLEAESIERVNNTFSMLAENAGISAEALKSGLEKAAGGMLPMTEVLTKANRAIARIGDNAIHLPEILELARKSGLALGKDVGESFDGLVNAISRGNQRALIGTGITLNFTKVLEAHSREIGISVNAMSDAEKQAARLQAVLEKGNEIYGDGIKNQDTLTATATKLGVAWTELKETFLLVFEKTIGPTLKTIAQRFLSFVTDLKNRVDIEFGPATKALNADLEIMNTKIEKLQAGIANMKSTNAFLHFDFFNVDAAQKKLDALIEKKHELEKTVGNASPHSGPPETTHDKADEEKRAQEKIKADEQMAKSDEKLASLRIANDKHVESSEFNVFGKTKELYQQKAHEIEDTATKEKAILAQAQANKDKIDEQYAKGTISKYQHERLLDNEDSIAKQKKLQLEDKLNAERVANTSSTLSILASQSKSSNQTMAEIGKAAGIAEIAIKTPVAIANAIASDLPYPLNFVAAAIVAAAMLEQAAAIGGVNTSGGSGASASVPSAGNIGGGVSGGSSPSTNATAQPPTSTPQKHVIVAFNGPVINTEQTRQWMADVIRANVDATDFQIKELGI